MPSLIFDLDFDFTSFERSMPKRQYSGGYGGLNKRSKITCAAEQAVSGLVAMVTDGVLQALKEQGVAPQPKLLVKCRRCLKHGHLARDCSAEVRCFRCHGSGHTVSVCPTPPPFQDLREKLTAQGKEPPFAAKTRRGEESPSSSESSPERPDESAMQVTRL